MSHTPERKQYPVRGTIINSSISVKDKDNKDKSFSQNSSLKGSFLSDGTCNLKPLVSAKPGSHTGDVPGLSKRYDPTARHQRKSTAGSNQGPVITNEFLSQNESLLKQIYDRQNQTLRYLAQQNLSYQHTGADMNISIEKNRLNQTSLPGKQKGFGEYEIPVNLTNQKIPTSINQSPKKTPDTGNLSQTQAQKSVLNAFLQAAQSKKEQNQVRPMISPHSATENEYYRADYQINRSEEKKSSRILQYQKSPKPQKPRDASLDSANCMDIEEHPQINTNEDDEDLVIDFRGVKSEDTFSDPYTLTHRVEPLELVPEEESSKQYTSTSAIRSKGLSDTLSRSKDLSDTHSREKLKVEDQETSKQTLQPTAQQPMAQLPTSFFSQPLPLAQPQVQSKTQPQSQAKAQPQGQIKAQSLAKPEAKKNDQSQPQVKGIVKANLDVDALLKQAKGMQKKKKKGSKKGKKTMSNKDSYSYYTESPFDITNASQVIKEETDEESPQVVEILEIRSIKSPESVRNDLLNYQAIGPDSKNSSPSVTDCQRPGSFMFQVLPTDRQYETFGKPSIFNDASPVIKSPKHSDHEDSKFAIIEPQHTRNTAAFMTHKRDQSQDSFTIKAQEDIAEMNHTQRNRSNESFISSHSQVPITTNTEAQDDTSEYYKSTRKNLSSIQLGTPSKVLNTSSSLPSSLQSILTSQVLKPVGDIPKHFQQPQKPGQKQKQKYDIVKYELGSNAIELLTPNYAKAYEAKLKHAIRMQNGDPLPSFIRAKVTQGGRRVIRIHQDDQVGVDQRYDLVMNVYHTDTGIFDSQTFTVKIKAPKKLTVTGPNLQGALDYAIRGPSASYPLPSYSVDEKRLSYSIQASDGSQVPQFVKIASDEKGKPCIKLDGDNADEKGNYKLILCVRDTVSGVVNRETKFSINATKGIQVQEMPAGFDDLIMLKGNTSDKITSLPKFAVENQADLTYEILDENDKLSDLLQLKKEQDGNLGIFLANDKGQLKVDLIQNFKLKVSQKTEDAVQVIPFKVFVDSQQPVLTLQQRPVSKVKYHVSSKAIEIPMPSYVMKNGTLEGVPHFTIGEKNGKEITQVLSVVKNDQGNQMLRIFCQDKELSGKYQVKFEATDKKSGINNDEAEFELTIAEPVLKLVQMPHSAFDSETKINYKPGNEPIYIPLPQYRSATAKEVKFRLTDKDGNPAPKFIKIETTIDKQGRETKQIVIQGKNQPADICYDINVHAYDEQTGSEQVHTISVQGIPAIVNLKEFKVPKTVQFNVGQVLQLPLPTYSQMNHNSELKLSLSDSTNLARIEKGMIVIKGGSGADLGTHEVIVIATEPMTGIQNREATFTLHVQAKLELEKVHKCFTYGIDVNIGDSIKLDLPQIKNSKSADYELQVLNVAQPQDNVRIHHRVKGSPQLLVSTDKMPVQETFEMQLTITEKSLNISEDLCFPVRFNLTAKIGLLRQPDEIVYKLGDEPIIVEIPKYETYPIKNKSLEFRIEGPSLAILKREQEQSRLFIQIQSEDQSFVGTQTCKIIVTDPETGISNEDANLVVNVMPQETKIDYLSQNDDFLSYEAKESCFTPESKARRSKGSRSKRSVRKVQVMNGADSVFSEEEKSEQRAPCFIIKCLPFIESLDYFSELIEYVDSNKPIPMDGQISMASQINEKHIRHPTPVYSSLYTSRSEYEAISFQSDDAADQTLPDGVKHEEIQDPTNPASIRKIQTESDQCSSDDAISNMSKIAKQTEEVEYEDVIPTLANTQHLKQSSRSQQVPRQPQFTQHSTSQTSPYRTSQPAKDDKTDESMHTSRLKKGTPEKEEFKPLQYSLLQFQQQLQTMQQLQHQQIQAHQASHQLLLMQQKIAEQQQSQSAINQSFQQPNNSMNKTQIQQQLQQFLNTNQALFDQIKLQEDIDLNKQLKLQIQQSIQRRQQQQTAMEQLQAERNHYTIHMNNQNQRQLIDHTGQLQEKDQLLQQLKFQLQQSWEQRSRFRHELNGLQQREDDLQAEIFFKDTQIKSASLRNSELSTKISETQFSLDRSVVTKSKPDEVYESYNHVSKFDDYEIQNKVHSATKHIERLRLELEDLNGQIAKSEAHIDYDRMKVNSIGKQMSESTYSVRAPPPLDSHRRYRDMPHSPVFEDVDETYMTEDLIDESFIQPTQQTNRQVQQKLTTPYRPRDNNIFGTPDEDIDPNDERARFTTTYTQFSQNQKFSGSKEGERGGLVLKKRKREVIAPLSFVEDENVAGMRSDYKQRKVEVKEKTIRDKVNQSIMSSRPHLFKRQEQSQSLQVPENDRRAKLSKMGQKLEQDRSKLVKMLQSSSTSTLIRYECEQQLSVVEDKLSIIQGKLKRC